MYRVNNEAAFRKTEKMKTEKTYLWRHELRGTTERSRRGSIPHIFLTQTIVCNFDVAIKCQKDVIKLQITIDDIIVVEIFQSQANFSGVELGPPQAELIALNMKHEVTTTDVFHHEVNTGFSLEAGMEIRQEWMPLLVGDQENSFLGFHAFNFVILNDEFFFQHFDGE